MIKTNQICVYCQKEVADTEDHIPGKQFFADPKPPPSELIAVPACRACNDQFSKIEDYVCSHLLFGRAGVSIVGKDIWQQRMYRTYQKNDGLCRVLAGTMHRLPTPSRKCSWVGGMNMRGRGCSSVDFLWLPDSQ